MCLSKSVQRKGGRSLTAQTPGPCCSGCLALLSVSLTASSDGSNCLVQANDSPSFHLLTSFAFSLLLPIVSELTLRLLVIGQWCVRALIQLAADFIALLSFSLNSSQEPAEQKTGWRQSKFSSFHCFFYVLYRKLNIVLHTTVLRITPHLSMSHLKCFSLNTVALSSVNSSSTTALIKIGAQLASVN